MGLTALWALATLAWMLNALWLLAIFDWLFGVVALIIWWTRRAKWVALLVQIVAARLMLHVLNYLTLQLFVVPYIHTLNATFVLLLVATAVSGGSHGSDSLLRRIRRIRGPLSAAPSREGLADAGQR